MVLGVRAVSAGAAAALDVPAVDLLGPFCAKKLGTLKCDGERPAEGDGAGAGCGWGGVKEKVGVIGGAGIPLGDANGFIG